MDLFKSVLQSQICSLCISCLCSCDNHIMYLMWLATHMKFPLHMPLCLAQTCVRPNCLLSNDIWTTICLQFWWQPFVKKKKLWWQPHFSLFSLVKNNGERKGKRENKNIIWVWERKLSWNSCTNIISLVYYRGQLWLVGVGGTNNHVPLFAICVFFNLLLLFDVLRIDISLLDDE